MAIRTVHVNVYHTLELDIPQELLDTDGSWELDDFIFDAFLDAEGDWDAFDIDIDG